MLVERRVPVLWFELHPFIRTEGLDVLVDGGDIDIACKEIRAVRQALDRCMLAQGPVVAKRINIKIRRQLLNIKGGSQFPCVLHAGHFKHRQA